MRGKKLIASGCSSGLCSNKSCSGGSRSEITLARRNDILPASIGGMKLRRINTASVVDITFQPCSAKSLLCLVISA